MGDIFGLDKVFGKLELPTLDLPEFELEPRETKQEEEPITEGE